ncbi:hypothetical protein [Microbulbifer variabilis]|uniref:hypothetical protein n=1 Tax=Microbulbifer variabilis TaxID=266805 RepID=UPI001CFC4840|nr:hypothetical protein [Microbulbifer variabilis]
MRFLLMIAFVFLVACERGISEMDVWVKPNSITITCENYSTISTDQGVLTNNVWNKDAARGDDWNQCLEKRLVDGEYQYGWSWSWPSGRKVIYSQPQIKIGSSPWMPEPKFDSSISS